MKTLKLFCLLAVAHLLPHASFADPTMVTNPVYNGAFTSQTLTTPTIVTPTVSNPTISGQTNSDLTASLPVFTDANKALVSKTVAATKTALGVQSGTCVTAADGTVTNTFSPAFSASPTVVAVQTGPPNSVSNYLTGISATTFIVKTSVAGVTNNWIAIGAP